jgi:hypothetical protein
MTVFHSKRDHCPDYSATGLTNAHAAAKGCRHAVGFFPAYSKFVCTLSQNDLRTVKALHELFGNCFFIHIKYLRIITSL